jgi:alpha,alpha-trehalase
MLANLLQELAVAQERASRYAIISTGRLDENPVIRLRRLIKDRFWDNLERRLDDSAIEAATADPKDSTADPRPRIYVPIRAPEQLTYYKTVAAKRPELRLDVQSLPPEITDDVYRHLNKYPGILALEMEEYLTPSGVKELRGLPFVVPGGIYNELYNWDSYFIALGLLTDGKIELVKTLVQNFIFQIQHYGLIPNANRSYYLLRSQPPFLTDLALRTYQHIKHEVDAKDFLKRAILASIKEYHKVWMSEPRLDPETGLSRYRPGGIAIPPECGDDSFAEILRPYAEKHGFSSISEFREKYNEGSFCEPELDEYFLHDRGLRESGHDVSLRVENVCADLATIDLNCLLYKYEVDIADTIRTVFNDAICVPEDFCVDGQDVDRIESSAIWDERARRRKEAIDTYLWNDEQGLYLDYNTKTRSQHTIESVTCLWALWSGVASPHQASILVEKALPKFECLGGLVSTTTDGSKAACHPAHQWDWPYGWAPHQVMAWDGLLKYDYKTEAERLIYRWMYTVTKTFVDYNGTVVEKYDVTTDVGAHKVNGLHNQGLGFKRYAKEGYVFPHFLFQNPKMVS